jgi:hypothetical protein
MAALQRRPRLLLRGVAVADLDAGRRQRGAELGRVGVVADRIAQFDLRRPQVAAGLRRARPFQRLRRGRRRGKPEAEDGAKG